MKTILSLRKRIFYLGTHTHTHTHTHIYIYIYIEREREELCVDINTQIDSEGVRQIEIYSVGKKDI